MIKECKLFFDQDIAVQTIGGQTDKRIEQNVYSTRVGLFGCRDGERLMNRPAVALIFLQ